MRLDALLHLPDGPLRLEVDAGAIVAVGPDAVRHLAARVDRRDRIVLDGRRIDRRGTAGRVRAGLGLVTSSAVAPDVSVTDHLAAVARPATARRLLAGAPLLAGRGADPAGVLSGGERRVLAVLRTAAGLPRVVVLDAPGEGLDPAALDWLGAQVAAWREAGVAVLLRAGRPEEAAVLA